MNLHVIYLYVNSSQILFLCYRLKNIFHAYCQNNMFYNNSTIKLMLLFKAKFEDFFGHGLYYIISAVYVVVSSGNH